MVLPANQYDGFNKGNYATIPGSQVMKAGNDRQNLANIANSGDRVKLNKTNKNQPNEALVEIPTKGKRLAQIDDDNYEEDFEEDPKNKKGGKGAKGANGANGASGANEDTDLPKTKSTAINSKDKAGDKDKERGDNKSENSIGTINKNNGGKRGSGNVASGRPKERSVDENSDAH